MSEATTDTRTVLEKGYPGPWQSELVDGTARVTSTPRYGSRRLVCVIPAAEANERPRYAIEALPDIVKAANALLAALPRLSPDFGACEAEAAALAAALSDGCVLTAQPYATDVE